MFSGNILCAFFFSQGLSPGITLAKDLCMLGFNVSLPGLKGKSERVLVVFGVYDDLQVSKMFTESAFQLSVESNSRLVWFCLTTLYDWSKGTHATFSANQK